MTKSILNGTPLKGVERIEDGTRYLLDYSSGTITKAGTRDSYPAEPYQTLLEIRFFGEDTVVASVKLQHTIFRSVFKGSFIYGSDGTLESATLTNKYEVGGSVGLAYGGSEVIEEDRLQVNPSWQSLQDSQIDFHRNIEKYRAEFTKVYHDSAHGDGDGNLHPSAYPEQFLAYAESIGLGDYFNELWLKCYQGRSAQGAFEIDGFNDDSPTGTSILLDKVYSIKEKLDPIINFNASLDTIVIENDVLGGDGNVNFITAKSKKEIKNLQKSEFNIIHNRKTGQVFYNANGNEPGFGFEKNVGLLCIIEPGTNGLNADSFRIAFP